VVSGRDKRRTAIVVTEILTGLAGIAATSRRLLGESVLTWGATPEEASSRLPGDELLADADMVSTRAITIDAPASAIWPWLVQMGVGRGGAYSYDWVERLLGLDMHSADRIMPELQHLEVGEVLPMKPGGPGMRVEILERPSVLSIRSEDRKWVWTFVLAGREGATRLLSRNRAVVSSFGDRLGMLFMEPASLAMERKMLGGIKQRAEQAQPAPGSASTNGVAGRHQMLGLL
jgi:hypothetical protein